MLRVLLSLPLRIALTVVLGGLCAFLCFQLGWFASLDLKIYDVGLNVKPGKDSESDIVIIAVDRYSRESCFAPPHFPISNHIHQHAQVIHRLKAAGAKVIAFDILFDQIDPKLDLALLDSALSEAGNVVLAGVIESQLLKMGVTGASIREERMAIPSAGISSSSYRLGLVNVPLGPDGVTRQCYYGKEFQGKWYPSLPVGIASAFTGKPMTRIKPGERFHVDYSAPGTGFLTIPYVHVLGEEGWQNKVEGRIALVGVVENGLSDTHKSPVRNLPGAAQARTLPGVLFLAYAANTLLENDMIAVAPYPVTVALSLLLIIVASLFVFGKRLRLNLLLLGFFTLVVLICGIWTVASNITILPTGKLIAILLLTGATGTLVNFSYTKLKSIQQESTLEEISSDLKMAQQIQQKLQPEKIPVMEEVDISGLQIPCKEIGGDYYDVIQVSDRKVAVLVADVSGKGISGAMVMSNFQSVVHSLAPKVDSPGKLFAGLNQAVSKIVTSGRFVTLFYGIFDRDTRRFVYANAGHTYPILCKADGKTSELSEGGLFLGPFPQATWQESEIQLESGDIVLVYTDGVTEATVKKNDRQFGEERLKGHLRENRFRTAQQINKRLLSTLASFTGSAQFEDDVTILTLKIL